MDLIIIHFLYLYKIKLLKRYQGFVLYLNMIL